MKYLGDRLRHGANWRKTNNIYTSDICIAVVNKLVNRGAEIILCILLAVFDPHKQINVVIKILRRNAVIRTQESADPIMHIVNILNVKRAFYFGRRTLLTHAGCNLNQFVGRSIEI